MADRKAKQVILQAPAKVNLCLDVVGEDGKGYHLLDGVMLAVDLYDTLTLRLEEGEGIQVVCNRPGIPLDEGNLAVKAAKAFLQQSGVQPAGKLLIQLEKRIPTQAGMAGGSADAAAVLAGLNLLLKTGWELSHLMEMGLNIGSDVPFCLMGGCARAKGRGERLEPLPLPGGVLVIAKPLGGNDTRRVFALYDAYEGPLLRPDVEGMVRALHQQDVAGVGLTMGNVFESICALEPLFALVHAMQVQGALGAAMTGTGTAVAGLFADEAAAQNCLQSLQQSQLPLEYLGIHRPVPGGPKTVEQLP